MGTVITHNIKPRDLAPKMKSLGDRFLKAYVKGARNAGHKIVQNLKNASRAVKDRGGYQNGWAFDQIVDAITIYNKAPWAIFVELGRRAGAKFPPPQPIIEWVKRHMGGTDKQVKSIAFLVARKISERGIKGRPLLLSPHQFNKNVQTYRREVDKALTQAMERK